MITVKELRSLFNSCDNDFKIRFQKWEHGNKEDFMKRNHYPMPNLVSIRVKKVITTANENHEWINHKFVLEDDFEDDFIITKDEALEYFCDGLDDYEMIDFELSTKDGNIPLRIFKGDTGYSDRIQMIDLEEVL